VERVIEVKSADQNAEKEQKIWRWLLSLLQWYGAEGMSSDETSVEGMETVYRVKILVWRRNIDKYLDYIDCERKLPTQALFSRSGARPVKRIRAEDNLISSHSAVPGLPDELYDAEWLQEQDEHYRKVTLCVSREQFEWMNIRVKYRDEAGSARTGMGGR
jgi:hypothetical protein